MKKFLSWCIAAAMIVSLSTFGVAEDKKDKEKKKPDFAAIFKKLDKDADGKLTVDEFTGKKDKEKAAKAFKKRDKDSDGSLSLEEFTPKPRKKKKADK